MSISSIAAEHAAKVVPSPCRSCTRRGPGCHASCPDWPKYKAAMEAEKQKILRNYEKECSAGDALITWASIRKSQKRKRNKRGGQ